MLLDIIILLFSLEIILLSCELFTNGIEWLGKLLGVGDSVVGSIFSAVGTCLPETIIPVLAIFFSDREKSMAIGIGAIAGAPFMLSTLAFFITGASVLIFRKKRNNGMLMKVDNTVLSRDIGFFILLYSIGILSSFFPSPGVKAATAIILISGYIFYLILTVRNDAESRERLEKLYMAGVFGLKPGFLAIFAQITLSFCGIIAGGNLFVANVEKGSEIFGISTLVLSLVITPIATELPEKFNSIIWIRRKKDTLAMGNITGAMVFQSCLPVSMGILFTPWNLDTIVLLSAAMALMSASVTYLWLKSHKRLTPVPLLAGGIFYSAFIAVLSFSVL